MTRIRRIKVRSIKAINAFTTTTFYMNISAIIIRENPSNQILSVYEMLFTGFHLYQNAYSNFLRYWPVCDPLTLATSSGVPQATISPPRFPPSGPRSMR